MQRSPRSGQSEPRGEMSFFYSHPPGVKEFSRTANAPMPGTYSQILLHIVFSTKERKPLIKSEWQLRLYDYMGGIVRAEKGVVHSIGGMPDHAHLLLRWRTDGAISDLMRVVKSRSSKWTHETFPDAVAFAWQEGYAVFSVSKSAEPDVKRYIESQPEHHQVRDFRDELLTLLRVHGIEFDPQYVFD